MNPARLPATARPVRVLFVFASLVPGDAATEVALLARHLDPQSFRIEALNCLATVEQSDLVADQLRTAGIRVDTEPHRLSFEDTIAYLARRLAQYEVVVSCQNVADIYPALERLHLRPVLIERGSVAANGPRHFTARYTATTPDVVKATVPSMHERPHHVVHLPRMVDFSAVKAQRVRVLPVLAGTAAGPLVAWLGRPDKPSDLEMFAAFALRLLRILPDARFLIVDPSTTPSAAYDAQARRVAQRMAFGDVVEVAGGHGPYQALARADVAILPQRPTDTTDILAEAGRAGVPLIQPGHGIHDSSDGGVLSTRLDPAEIALAVQGMLAEPARGAALTQALRQRGLVARGAAAIVPQWARLMTEVLTERAPVPEPATFQSFHLGGFESSSHRLRDGTRLDLIASSGHLENAEGDYRQLGQHGMRAFRDALRWHAIETAPGRYDFTSFRAMQAAASRTGAQVIWDLMHYGWPDDIDIWSAAFVKRFAAFAAASARAHREATDAVPFWCPVNEISFFAWGGGDVGYLNPFARGRGFEMKVQLARAAIEAMHALRAVDPRARFVHCEPAIAIHHDPGTGRPLWEAEGWHQAQFQAFELIAGRMWPQIGGQADLLDIVGINYYANNQWIHGGPPIDVNHPLYRPFSDLLVESHARYGRPILIAETGTEGDRRAEWFTYVADEVDHARSRGVPVEGICLYPILDHKGWDDDRMCPNGLLSHQAIGGRRGVHEPLAQAIARRSRQDAGDGHAPAFRQA